MIWTLIRRAFFATPGRFMVVAPKPRCGESEEQAFYAAQEEALTDLRAYHAARPRRKRRG